MENLVNIKINGFDYQVPAGSTILEAAHSAGIEIPTLCYLKDINDDIIFKSPGIRYDVPEIAEAVNNGAVLTSEMEAFFEVCPCRIIGVTGSDGKTTTTSLIAAILKAAGKTVWLGGNIGTPLLPLVRQMKEEDFAVVELSSFGYYLFGYALQFQKHILALHKPFFITVLVTFCKAVRIVYLARIIHRNRGSYTTRLALLSSIIESLQSLRTYHHIRLNDKQVGIRLQSPTLTHLQD